MLEFTSSFPTNSRELCISAKNHCTSIIHRLLQQEDSNLKLLTPYLLSPSTETKLPLEYAIHSTMKHRLEYQSTMDTYEPVIDRIEEQETYKYLRCGQDARERIAHEVISLLATKTIHAIQEKRNNIEHTSDAHKALARLLSITDFCFEDITEKMQGLLKQCSEAAENLSILAAPTSPVFTTLYDDLTITPSAAPVAATQDMSVRALDTLKLTKP